MGCLKLPYQKQETQTLRVVYRKSETKKVSKVSETQKTTTYTPPKRKIVT